MPLYLVRHAHAVSEDEDRRRPLSERGRGQVRTLAEFFRGHNQFTPVFAWHSPLERARETASLLLSGLGSEAAMVETPGLRPEDDPAAVAARLAAIAAPINIAIFGHEPHLGALASLLLGHPGGVADVRKASVLALDRTPLSPRKGERAFWHIEWFVHSEFLAAKAVPPATAAPWPR